MGKCHGWQITTGVSSGGDCSAAGGEGRDTAAMGRRLILIIAMRFNTVQLPASLLYTKARSVIQRDAAITANHLIPGCKALQPALEKNFGRSFKKAFSLSLACYLLIPLKACRHQGCQQAQSLAGNPGQEPYLSAAQEQQSPVRCVW